MINLEQAIANAIATEKALKEEAFKKEKIARDNEQLREIAVLMAFARTKLEYQDTNLVDELQMQGVFEYGCNLAFTIGGENYTDYVVGGRQFLLSKNAGHLYVSVRMIVESENHQKQFQFKKLGDSRQIERAEELLVLIDEQLKQYQLDRAKAAERKQRQKIKEQLSQKYDEVNKQAVLELQRLERLIRELNELRIAEEKEFRNRMDDYLQSAKAAQWQWPAGKVLTLYHWEWCKGGYTDEEGTNFDYEYGWSLTDKPDEEGYVPILQELEYDGSNRYQITQHFSASKDVKVPKNAIVTRHTFKSMAELPSTLRHKEYHRFDYWKCFDHYAAFKTTNTTEQGFDFSLYKPEVLECDEHWFITDQRSKFPNTPDITINWHKSSHYAELNEVPLRELRDALE